MTWRQGNVRSGSFAGSVERRGGRVSDGWGQSDEPRYRPLPPARVLPPPQHHADRRPAPVQQRYPGPPTQQPYQPTQAPPTQQPYPVQPTSPPDGYAPPDDRQQGYLRQPPQEGYGRSAGYGQPSPGYAFQPPQWGYGGWGPPVQRRRRGPVAAILLGLVGLAAAGLFVLILVGAATQKGSGSSAVTDEAAVDHKPAHAADPGTTPVNPSDARDVVDSNTLYAQGGLANGDCPAKNLGDATREKQTVFYQALMDCLNDEWRPRVEAAGYSYEEPGLVVFDTPVDTPCGNVSPQDGRTLAFYCPGDSVMYADVPQMRKFFDNVDVAYAIVIGHEFGHHVQEETGILTAYDDLVYDDFADRLELDRRVELQASCMGGLFLGAVAETFPIDDERLRRLEQVSGSFGDEPGGADDKRDHGSGVSNREWIFAGYTENDAQTCNTFTAPAGNVD